MRYEVYKPEITGDDKLIANNLTKEQAEDLKRLNPQYVIVPQYINGA